VLPDKVPVKTTPAPLNVTALPIRLPLMWRGLPGEGSMNTPSNPVAVRVNVSVQPPLFDPLHNPSHVPLRSGGASVAVGVSVGIDVGIGVVCIGAWVGGRCNTATRTPTVAVTATSTARAAAGLHLLCLPISSLTASRVRSLAQAAGARTALSSFRFILRFAAPRRRGTGTSAGLELRLRVPVGTLADAGLSEASHLVLNKLRILKNGLTQM
jgi:hypothetical protein